MITGKYFNYNKHNTTPTREEFHREYAGEIKYDHFDTERNIYQRNNQFTYTELVNIKKYNRRRK